MIFGRLAVWWTPPFFPYVNGFRDWCGVAWCVNVCGLSIAWRQED